MNLEERERLIHNLMHLIHTEIKGNLSNMPETWDGNELRQYVADKSQEVISRKMGPKRMKAYENEVMIRNL